MNQNKPQPSRAEIPEGFTPAMALTDAVPVLLFCGSTALISAKIPSALFRIGAVLCVAAGAGKVLWKLLIAFARRNVPALSRQLRFLMPAGFALMLAGAVSVRQSFSAAGLWNAAASFPQAAFFLAGLAGIAAMAVFAFGKSRTDAQANWVEQIVNAAAQACIFVGILLLR
jgi:hypothetical protein